MRNEFEMKICEMSSTSIHFAVISLSLKFFPVLRKQETNEIKLEQ